MIGELARSWQGPHDDAVALLVSEVFTSIQGEGSAQGLPCAFVRLAGCPLRCRWCDTTYARDGGRPVEVAELVRRVGESGLPLVEITGGEPLVQEETPALARALLDAGYRVLCETSGAFDIGALPDGVVRVMDLKAPSSGEEHRIRWSNLDRLRPTDDVKIVVADRADYTWARRVVAERHLPERCRVLLSPAAPLLDGAALAEWIVGDRLPVRLQIQLHRVLWPGANRRR